jgi:hypothetical protein
MEETEKRISYDHGDRYRDFVSIIAHQIPNFREDNDDGNVRPRVTVVRESQDGKCRENIAQTSVTNLM